MLTFGLKDFVEAANQLGGSPLARTHTNPRTMTDDENGLLNNREDVSKLAVGLQQRLIARRVG